MSDKKYIVVTCNNGKEEPQASKELELKVGDQLIAGVTSLDVHKIEKDGLVLATIEAYIKLGEAKEG